MKSIALFIKVHLGNEKSRQASKGRKQEAEAGRKKEKRVRGAL
jgi:hypothetical protein